MAFLTNSFIDVYAVIGSASIILILFVMRVKTFITTDKIPELTAFVPKRENTLGSEVAWVHVGMSIQDFPVFDATRNDFIADMILWFEFDPTQIPLNTVDAFSFEKGSILKKAPPVTIKCHDKLFVHYDLRVQFSSNLDFKEFPFDNHKITLTLVNEAASPEEMNFHIKESAFALNSSLYTVSWLYLGHTVREGFSKAALDKYDVSKMIALPKAQVIMDFKGGWRKIFIIFVPLYLLSFLGAFTLQMQKDQLFLCLGSLSGLLAHRFVVESISPKVGYFTLSDQLYIVQLLFSFLFFLINIGSFISGIQMPLLKNVVFFSSLFLWDVITYFIVLRRGKKQELTMNTNTTTTKETVAIHGT